MSSSWRGADGYNGRTSPLTAVRIRCQTLAWALRDPSVIAIPKAGDVDHVQANHRALELLSTAEDLAAIDAEFSPPRRKTPLAMI